MQGVGCAAAADVAGCLRAKPFGDIVRAAPFKSPSTESADYAPRIDGWVLRGNPVDLVEGDLAPNKASLIIGSTADEMNAHALESDVAQTILSPNAGEEAYAQALEARFGQAVAQDVLSLYPASDFANSPLVQNFGTSPSFAAILRVLTDSAVTCPVRALARHASTGNRTVYRYFFAHAIENDPRVGPLGAFDNEDNWFVFRSIP